MCKAGLPPRQSSYLERGGWVGESVLVTNKARTSSLPHSQKV